MLESTRNEVMSASISYQDLTRSPRSKNPQSVSRNSSTVKDPSRRSRDDRRNGSLYDSVVDPEEAKDTVPDGVLNL